MTLPASQQHALDAIDDVLQSSEPRLATMFGVFTDLTRLEAMPPVETLPPGRWWTRRGRPGPRYRPGWLAYQRHRPGQQRYQRYQRYQHGRRATRRLRQIVLVPLLLLAAVSLLIVGLVSSGPAGRRGCGQAVAAVMASQLRSAVSDTAGSGGTQGTVAAGLPSRRRRPGRRIPIACPAAARFSLPARWPAAGPRGQARAGSRNV